LSFIIQAIQSTEEDEEAIEIKSSNSNNLIKITKLDQIISLTLYSINKIINNYNSNPVNNNEYDDINHIFVGFLSQLNLCISNIKSQELRSYHINSVMLTMLQTGQPIDYILNYSYRSRYRLFELNRFNYTYSYINDNNDHNNKYLPECCNNNSSIHDYLLQCFNLPSWSSSGSDSSSIDNHASIIPWGKVSDEELRTSLILNNSNDTNGGDFNCSSYDNDDDDDGVMNSAIDETNNMKLFYNKLKKKYFNQWLPKSKCYNKSLTWSMTGIAIIAYNVLFNATSTTNVNNSNVNNNNVNYVNYLYSNEYKCKLFVPYLLVLLRNRQLSSYEGLKYSIAIGKIMTLFHITSDSDTNTVIKKNKNDGVLSINSYGPFIFISDLLTTLGLDSNSTNNTSNNHTFPLSHFVNYYNKSRNNSNNNNNNNIISKKSSLCVGIAAANSFDILSIFQALISKYPFVSIVLITHYIFISYYLSIYRYNDFML
jgi:hypothetical protein